MSTSYTGSIIKVRSSSDDATQDVGYDAGNHLDTNALKTFVGSGSGFIDTWYDQSGNNRNQTMATTGNQLRIVNSGVIERRNGQPAVYFNGSTCMASASFSALSSGFTVAIIAGVNSNVTYNTFANKTQSNIGMPFDQWNTNYYIGNGSLDAGPRTLSTGISSAAGYSQWSYAGSSSAAGAWRMGVSNTSTAAPMYYSDGNVPFMLGTRQDLVTHLDGHIGEVVLFPAVLSSGNRGAIECNQTPYFLGLAISGSTVLSSTTTSQLKGGISGGTWSSSATGIATVNSTTGVVTGVTSGFTTNISYTLSGTGCYAVNSMAVNPCRMAGEEEVTKASAFSLIPNPNSGTFTLKGRYSASAKEEEVSIEVVNTLGQSVYRSTIKAEQGRINEQVTLPGTLANGMYLLNLHTPNEQAVFHFVISK